MTEPNMALEPVQLQESEQVLLDATEAAQRIMEHVDSSNAPIQEGVEHGPREGAGTVTGKLDSDMAALIKAKEDGSISEAAFTELHSENADAYTQALADKPTQPLQEGVEHGPYVPMDTEEEAKMAEDVEAAIGYLPEAGDGVLLQEAHQLENHKDAINEAGEQGRINVEAERELRKGVDIAQLDIEDTLQEKAFAKLDTEEGEVAAGQQVINDIQPQNQESLGDLKVS